MSSDASWRLPEGVTPIAYRLWLDPSIGPESGGRFRGEVEIDIDIAQPTDEVVIHASALVIATATVDGRQLSIRLLEERETVRLRGERRFERGRCTLRLVFSGLLTRDMHGPYEGPPGSNVELMTQLQATHARRLLPCFDEPALKATFELTVEARSGVSLVSNTPILSSTLQSDGRTRVRFAKTPRMSTYLLALVIGTFASLEGQDRQGIPLRCLVAAGRSEHARFALDIARRGLDFFHAYTGIAYADMLHKLDLVALPEFEASGMENWGAIFFREEALLVDPASSSLAQRRRVAEVVLHEVAHQWFGNYVTAAFWDDLWLNESLATLLAYKALDALFPEWDVWQEYRAVVTSTALAADSMKGSHPIYRPVASPCDIEQAFDAVTYDKGGSVLRMLEAALGEDVFRSGLNGYLAAHAFGSATRHDLFRALERARPTSSEAVRLVGTVEAFLTPWIERVGFPLVRVVSRDGRLELEQCRFLLDGDSDPETRPCEPWPLSLEIGIGSKLKLNVGETNLCIIAYDGPALRCLVQAIVDGELEPIDRYGVQENAYLLARAGRLGLDSYLEVVAAYEGEREPWVMSGLLAGLRAMRESLVGLPIATRLSAAVQRLVLPCLEQLGWLEREGELPAVSLLRSCVIEAALDVGASNWLEQARAWFEIALRAPGDVPMSILPLVLRSAARHGSTREFDGLLTLYEDCPTAELRAHVLGAMGAFLAHDPLTRALELSVSSAVRPHDTLLVFGGASIERKASFWCFLRERWAELDLRLGDSMAMGHLVAAAASGVPTEAHAAEVERFFEAHPSPFAAETIALTVERIRARARFRSRHEHGPREVRHDATGKKDRVESAG